VALEEVRDLLVYLLDGLMLLLVRVQDLEEGLVRLGLLVEARLDLGNVGAPLIELDGGLLAGGGRRRAKRSGVHRLAAHVLADNNDG
jgi:hypothetical protein